MHDEITIAPARYAKGQMAVQCPSDGSGYKTRAMRLCAALNARWSNRCCAYIMSPSKAARLQRLAAEGWDATTFTRELLPPDGAA